MSTAALIQTLKVRQGDQSDAAFASRLGVNRETWRKLKHGKGRPGRRVLEGIMRAFPDLQLAVAASLAPGNAGIATQAASALTDTEVA